MCCGCGAAALSRIAIVSRDSLQQDHILSNSATAYLHLGFRHPAPSASPSASSSSLKSLDDPSVTSSSSLSLCSVSYSDCVLSLFVLSNEWVNVWSHLLAALAFAAYFPLHLLGSSGAPSSSPPPPPAAAGDDLPPFHFDSQLSVVSWVLFFLGCTFSFATSAGYHLFLFHSPEAFSLWVRLDLLGVTAGICASSFLGLSVAFQCFPFFQRFYLGSIFCLMCYAMAVQMSPHFHTERYNTRRLFLFGFLMAFGVMPTIHWSLIAPQVEVSLFLSRVVMFYLIVATAAFFYASKFPERAFPKNFDYFFSSHQLWHILIVVSMVWWYFFCLDYARYRIATPCSA